MPTKRTFVVTSRAGARRDLSKGAREQPYGDEHGVFIDALVADGFVVMGGPLVDEGGAMMVVRAEEDDEVRTKLAGDPWYEHDVLQLESIKRWHIFIDRRD